MTVENGGGGGGVEAPVERMRVERTVWENEKKKKKKKWSELAGQREKMDSVKMSGGEWWVVGLGGGTHGPQKCWLFFIFIFFYLNWWDVTAHLVVSDLLIYPFSSREPTYT